MELLSIGLSHKTAAIDVRERVYYPPREIPSVLQFLIEKLEFQEVALLSTCNRTEIYAVAPENFGAESVLINVLAERAGSPHEDAIRRSVTVFESSRMVHHLLRVASGIESMVLGEGQILGQVRQAGEIARASRASGPILNTLFNMAVASGKRARSETSIARRPVSIAHVAVDLAKRVFESLIKRRVLLVGAGKMSAVAVQYLKRQGVEEILVVNRTREHAEDIARDLGAVAVEWGDLLGGLVQCDLVISSTSASGYILDRSILEKAMALRNQKSLVLVDIAIPRDVDPSVTELDNVHLYNLDSLQRVVDDNLRQRGRELPRVLEIIEEEEANFFKWLSARSVFVREREEAPQLT